MQDDLQYLIKNRHWLSIRKTLYYINIGLAAFIALVFTGVLSFGVLNALKTNFLNTHPQMEDVISTALFFAGVACIILLLFSIIEMIINWYFAQFFDRIAKSTATISTDHILEPSEETILTYHKFFRFTGIYTIVTSVIAIFIMIIVGFAALTAFGLIYSKLKDLPPATNKNYNHSQSLHSF